jgi:hypothetical protein
MFSFGESDDQLRVNFDHQPKAANLRRQFLDFASRFHFHSQ